jgi:cell division protease FtsH
MNSKIKIVLWLLGSALLCAAVLVWTFAAQRSGQSTISYSQFLQQVDAGRVAEVKISAGNSGADPARVRLMTGAVAQTVLPADYSVALAAMQQRMVNVEIQNADANPTRLLINATPFLILLAVWVFFMLNRGLLGRGLLGRR